MTKTIRLGSLFLVLAVAAGCGGAKKSATTAPIGDDDTKMEHEGEEHGEMPPAVHAFHEQLAPLWHAPEGDERAQHTCEAVPAMKAQAAAIEGSEGLVAALDALAEACAADGRPDFAAKFGAVHDAFHAVLEQSQGGQGAEGAEHHE